jgi:hypothetical protein
LASSEKGHSSSGKEKNFLFPDDEWPFQTKRAASIEVALNYKNE